MVAELWIVTMGSQVSTNLKHALLHQPKSQTDGIEAKSQRIGILSFEVANVMSKTICLYKSLTDSEMSKLRSEISASEGVRTLVSSDQNRLLGLVLAEKLDDLNAVASAVSRLGKRCSEPALRGFEHVYADVVGGVIEVGELGFLVRDMDAMVRKLERYVNATSSLYGEMEVLSELEQATRKFQNNQHEESRRAFEQKLAWQRQDVRHLREVSLWNQTYDKVVELLARTVCTVYARVRSVFGDTKLESLPLKRCLSKSSEKSLNRDRHQPDPLAFPSPGRLFMECLGLGSRGRDYGEERSSQVSACLSSKKARLGPESSELARHAPASTVGGSALALRYANVVTVIEKLLRCPHLVGEEARDDLYRMLPASLRSALRASLRPCAKSLAIYDAPLAHDWREALDGVLGWLAPLAHSTVRWQSERNFEQSRMAAAPAAARTNVLLVQTLYFADRAKTEAAICRLLVGLNYICRYEHQQNALLDCATSFDFDDYLDWQLHCTAAYVD